MSNSEKMLSCLEEQDLNQAETYFWKALEEDSPETLMDLAAYLEGLGFLPQARQIYERLLGDYPELGIQLAQIAIEDGQIEEAQSYLEEIEEESPFYLEALLVKADLYQSEGLADVAREKLLLASQLSADPIILFGLAEIELELGAYQEAIQHYAQLDNREIYQLTGISTYQRIGLAYASLGRFEVATEFLEKAVELEYDDQTVFELATLLVERGEWQKAIVYFKQLATINPDFTGYESLYAQALHAEHRLAEARAIVEQGLTKNDFDEQLLLLASQYAYEDHDVAEAEVYLLRAKEWAEDVNEVSLRLSTLYLQKERWEELVRLETDDLDNVLARWHIAKGYQMMEQEEVAQTRFEDLLTDLGDNPEFLADYIGLLRQQGQARTAKQYAKQYLAIVPDDVDMQEFYNQE